MAIVGEVVSNGTFQTAQFLDLGNTVRGSLSSTSDLDYFRVTANASGVLVLDFSAPQKIVGTSFTVAIYEKGGNLLLTRETGSAPSLVVPAAAAGSDYYIQVSRGHASTFDSGIYSLTAHIDSLASLAAKTLAGVGSISSTLNASHDWYAVNLTAGTSYEFGVAGSSSGGGTLADPSLTLCYANGATIEVCDNLAIWSGTRTTTVADPQIAFTAPTTGTYYLMIGGNGGTGSYTLSEKTDALSSLQQDLLHLQADPNERWNGGLPLGTPVVLTYSFMTTAADGATEDGETGFRALTVAQQQIVRSVLGEYGAIANITFTQTTNQATAQIRFGTSNQPDSAGVTYTSQFINGPLQQADVFIDNSAGMPSLSNGSYSLLTLIHEIGHALGLKHPGNYNAGGGGASSPYLPLAWDNAKYTTMSYVDNLDTAVNAQTPGLLDIAAVQYLYGVNNSTTPQASPFTFSATSPFVSALLGGAGARYSIDLHDQSLGATLLLRPGSLSSVGVNANGNRAIDNLAIPFNLTVIQATGGSGSDLIIGYDLDSTLSGGAGNDTLVGGLGTDTAVFSGIPANYTVTPGAGDYVITDNIGRDGTDTLSGIERLQFADGQLLIFDRTSPNAASYQTVVQQIYIAYFGRPADYYGQINLEKSLLAAGVAPTAAALTAAYGTNAAVKSLVDSFGISSESTTLYGTGTTASFVNAIFNHVLNRDALPAGSNFWVDAIDNRGLTRGNAALAIMNGALENPSPQGLVDALAVAHKVTVASDFTHAMDTVLEINSYAGAAAAASARAMLQPVSNQTDTNAYQATVTTTLLAMTTVAPVVPQAMAAAFDAGAAAGMEVIQTELSADAVLIGVAALSPLPLAG